MEQHINVTFRMNGASHDLRIPTRMEAVSYTHLDVYKRQHQCGDETQEALFIFLL